MKDQHEKIKGYRDLNQDEIDMMNKIKQKGIELGALIEDLATFNAQTGGHAIDMRWVAIGKTDLQTGIMALVRSVAQPTTF
jgi:hypothetical protein